MILFQEVDKTYRLKKGDERVVLRNCNACFPTGARVGVLGLNGAGKSTLLRLLAGAEHPTRGRIVRSGRVSFPVGFTGTFHPLHSARENIKFLSHIYDMDFRHICNWIEDFSELGSYFDMPVATYSSGMFARIAFATSFAFDFDTYLVDEAIEVGDVRFRAKCVMAFQQRMQSSSLVLVSQNASTIRQYCDRGAVLHNGSLQLYDTLDEALDKYEFILRAQ